MFNNTAYKVGFFVTISALALGGVILYFGEIPLTKRHELVYYAYFKNVAGLSKGSDVRVAGVKVGKVKNFIFENGKVKVVLEIYRQVPIYKDAKAEIKSLGILGDKYVEIDPGHPEAGLLPNKSTIAQTSVAPSISEMVETFQKTGKNIDKLVYQLTLLIESNRKQIEQLILNLNALAVNLNNLLEQNTKYINKSLKNIAILTRELRISVPKLLYSYERLTELLNVFAEKSLPKTQKLIENLNKVSYNLSHQLPHLINNLTVLSETLATNKEAIKGTLQNLYAITNEIKEGRGSLGRLIKDPTLYRELKKSAKTLSEAAGVITKTKLHIEAWGQYETEGDSKAGVNVILQPSHTHYYLLGIVGDSAGKVTKKVYYSNGQEREQVEKQYKPEVTLQYARIFPDKWLHPGSSIVARFGIKESTGGVGLDYVYNNRLMFFFDIWDFGREDRPNEDLKPNTELGVKYIFASPFFVKLGGYDLLNSKYRSFLIGGGMSFTDNDLKYLMGAMKVPGF